LERVVERYSVKRAISKILDYVRAITLNILPRGNGGKVYGRDECGGGSKVGLMSMEITRILEDHGE